MCAPLSSTTALPPVALPPAALGQLAFLMAREVAEAAADCSRIHAALPPLTPGARLGDDAISALHDLGRVTQALQDVATVLATMFQGHGLPAGNQADAVATDALLTPGDPRITPMAT